MILVLKPDSSAEQVSGIVKMLMDLDIAANILFGTERTVVGGSRDARPAEIEQIQNLSWVERVLPILAPYKMASREAKPQRSVIPLGGKLGGTVGGRKVAIVAGPCSVESRAQTLEIAHAVAQAGAVGLRGGAFKPRTNPYSFQGHGEEGLRLLAQAREQTGLAVVTEVMSAEQVPLVAEYADVLQIGARNMQNFNLLSRVGSQQKPVLLKRGMSATLEEFLLAAEYILARGNPNVILCERGIRTFEDYVRNTLPVAIVPELHRVSHLPVMVDPSHGTGRSYLVEAASKAAVAAGADGLMIEVHPDPAEAMTDGAQSVTPQEFADLVASTRRVAAAVDREI